MSNYLVTWQIDTDNNSPREAAEYAERVRSDPASMAHVYDVVDRATRITYRVDLDTDEIQEIWI